MKRATKKLLSLILIITMITSYLPVEVAFAGNELGDVEFIQSGETISETTSGSAINYEEFVGNKTISKSKTAEWITEGEKAKVALSIPDATTAKVSSDIVFALDKSSCKEETAAKAEELFKELENAIETYKTQIKVGVVVFDGTSHVRVPLTEYSNELKDTLIKELSSNNIPSSEKVSGTNMQAGLVAVNEMLAADTDVKSENKYVILISDGLTRLFSDDKGIVKDIYYQYSYADRYGLKSVDEVGMKNMVYFGMIGEWDDVRNGNDGKSYALPYGSWNEYFGKVSTWVKNDGDKYAYDYSMYGNDATSKVKNVTTGEVDSSFNYIAHDDYENHAMSVDRAVYEAYNQFKSMVKLGYQCYAYKLSNYEFSNAFMGALNKMAGNTTDLDFSTIKNEILYAVDNGSYVTDIIGKDFDLTDVSSIKVLVNGVELNKTEVATNKWSFGDGRYIVEYTNINGVETLIWTFNEAVTNFTPAQLIYELELVNKSTTAGEHTTYTNESAVITAIDTKGGKLEEEFDRPELKYFVESKYAIVTVEHDFYVAKKKVVDGVVITSDYEFDYGEEANYMTEIIGKEFEANALTNLNRDGLEFELFDSEPIQKIIVAKEGNNILFKYRAIKDLTKKASVVVNHYYEVNDVNKNIVTQEEILGNSIEMYKGMYFTPEADYRGTQGLQEKYIISNPVKYTLNYNQINITNENDIRPIELKEGQNIINIYYVMEKDSEEEPIEPVVPTEPENPAPIEPVVPTPEDPIEEEEVPGGEVSEDPTPEEPVEEQPEEPVEEQPEEPVEEQPEESIEEEEVPAGKLPDTGGVAAPIFYGLGALALASGLFVGRKKKDNCDE